jgi:hypothetical protein
LYYFEKNMKTTYIFALIAVLFWACDIVEPQNAREFRPSSPNDTTQVSKKAILVEDFTGHQCGNCPRAGEVAKQLDQVYGSEVVIVAIHCGFFSRTNSSGKYSTDFTTSFGNAIDAYFGASQAGLPKGMVNRREFAGSKLLGHTSWAGKVEELLQEPLQVNLLLSANFDAVSRQVSAQANATFLKDLSGNYGLVLALTEDKIINWQKDYSLENQDIPNYQHNHVLRAVINGSWQGEDLASKPQTGFKAQKQATYVLNSAWIEKNMNLIGYVYDKSTFEVLQAASIKVISQ